MKRFFYIIAILILFQACSNLNKLSLYNLSNLYSNTLFTVLDAVAFNTGGESARVYVPVFMHDMVAAFDEDRSKDYKKVSLKYELFETYESKQILDSATIILVDSTLFLDDTLISFDIHYPDKREYILKLELTDLNRVDVVRNFITLDNSSPYANSNYLLKDSEGNLMFSDMLSDEEAFVIQVNDSVARSLFVRFYNRKFPLALPPFLEETEANFDYRADSIFVVETRNGLSEIMLLPEEGFYHFQIDSNHRGGLTLFRYHKGFPAIITPEQMLQPLRYITTTDEYEEMEFSTDIKLAVDNFWLHNAGNPTRARAMIQKYYGRVVDANEFFTSYQEGWKTDRGLIYIVYGPPRIVYRGKGVEEWLYGEKGNNNSIRFQFVKVINPFTGNDYSLIKSPAYKEKWYNIVNTWRR